MRNIILVITFSCFVVCPSSYAQEKKPPETPYRLDDIVVTASKVSLPEEKVTQKVDVIHDTQWDNYTFADRNISEILTYQPGAFVNPLSRNDANWGSYGGLGPKYSTYMLDGLPIDSFVDGMSLDPWAFDRVEVQRGPASVMYSNYLSQDFAGNTTVAMEKIGISHLTGRPYTGLSGGERQLVMIARVLAQEPKVILLDEPISHLDFTNQSRILRLLKNLVLSGMTIVAVIHDPTIAFMYGDRFLFMKDGCIKEPPEGAGYNDPAHLTYIYDMPVEVVEASHRIFVGPRR